MESTKESESAGTFKTCSIGNLCPVCNQFSFKSCIYRSTGCDAELYESNGESGKWKSKPFFCILCGDYGTDCRGNAYEGALPCDFKKRVSILGGKYHSGILFWCDSSESGTGNLCVFIGDGAWCCGKTLWNFEGIDVFTFCN